ncbi:MAG: tetratricopeptide repeat protein [bacterium]|nr:tetratricopeptide repeat protein [bacterium]
MGWVWDRGSKENPARRLWRLVSPESVTPFGFPSPGGSDLGAVVGVLEDRVRAAELTYAPPPTVFGPGADSQAVRSPVEVWQSQEATCVDVSLLVAAGCLKAGVRPWLIVGQRSDGSAHAWLVYDAITPLARDKEGPGDLDVDAWESAVSNHRANEKPGWLEKQVKDGGLVAVDVTGWCVDYEPLNGTDLFDAFEQVWVCDVAAWWHPLGVEPITGIADTQLVDPLWEIPDDTSRLGVAELTVANRRVVPFVPGEDSRRVVDQTTTWAHSTKASDRSGLGLVGLGLITGVGGAGKTRTALEVADTLCGPEGSLDPHALCGILPREINGDEAAAIAGRPGTVLLVVDYADSHPHGDIERLARALRTRPAGWGPVIVLATARSAGDWLHSYVDTLRGVDNDSITMLGSDQPDPADAFVARGHIDTVDHTALAQAATGAFNIDPMRVDGYDTALEVILEIALAAAGEHNPDRPGDTIYDRVLRHERDHWNYTATRDGGPGHCPTGELNLAVTAATLLEPTAAQLRAIGREIGWAEAVRETVIELYATSNKPDPHQRRIGPLRPDPIADHLIRNNTATPPTPNEPGWLNRLTQTITTSDQWATFLNTTNRAWADQPNPPNHLTNTIHTALTENRLPLNVALDAATTPGPTRTALTQLANNNTHTVELVDQLNQRSQLGLEYIAEPAYTHHLHNLRTNPNTNPTDLATTLGNLGITRSYQGNHETALALQTEALELVLELIEVDTTAYPIHARTLGNLAATRSHLGDHRTALRNQTASVQIWRTIAEDDPNRFPDLAHSLANLGTHHSHERNHDAALAAKSEAVDLWRRLGADDPAHLPDLGRSVGSLSATHYDLGNFDLALRLSTEAVEIVRTAATNHPALRPDLARNLGNLGVILNQRADHAAAVEVQTDAVEMWRIIATDNPAHGPELARSLGDLGFTNSALKEDDAALEHSLEALERWRITVADNPRHTADLARQMGNLSVIHSHGGAHDAALGAIAEAVELWRGLAVDDAHAPDLALALRVFALCLGRLGREQEATLYSVEAEEFERGHQA